MLVIDPDGVYDPRLINDQKCLRFLTDPRTPFTNTVAERDLRMGKLRQKISGGLRSMQGARDFASLRAVNATARK